MYSSGFNGLSGVRLEWIYLPSDVSLSDSINNLISAEQARLSCLKFVNSQQNDVLDFLCGYQILDFLIFVRNTTNQECRFIQVTYFRLKCIHYRDPYCAAIAVDSITAASWQCCVSALEHIATLTSLYIRQLFLQKRLRLFVGADYAPSCIDDHYGSVEAINKVQESNFMGTEESIYTFRTDAMCNGIFKIKLDRHRSHI